MSDHKGQQDIQQIAASDLGFRLFMVEKVTDLSTKMNALVGQDGTNGWKGDTETEIADLKKDLAAVKLENSERKGFRGGLAVLSNLVSGSIGAVVMHFLGKR